MKVVILGKGNMLANLIEGVSDAGFEIAGVFRYERTCMNSLQIWINDSFKSSPDITLIKKLKLNEIKLKSANCKEFKDLMLKLNVDIIIVGTWKEKIKKEIFDIPKIATINVHPSLLPKYRGPNPYLQTILHGEKFSGITFHLMSEKFDEGPILAQKKIEILPVDTSKELKEKTVYQARLVCSELLKKLNEGVVMPIEQNESESSYYPNITGDEKMLDFKKQTSYEIVNTVRALHPYLPAYITYKKDFYIVNPYSIKITDKTGTAGEILQHGRNSMTIACKDGIALEMNELKKYNKFFTIISS